ncbi:MAG: hypothetical protein GF400_10935 [Candidatus Eisenbacteria bacterium]|nr:hypothetical protein [Candidatus Eisenbacteria bacterium]
MKHTVDIPVQDVVPHERTVLRAMGVPRDREPGEQVARVLEEARDELRSLARPRGIYAEVSPRDFARIYRGDGDNERPNPLESIFPRADHLALFAVTLGAGVSDRIPDLFGEGRLALGATLDAAASESVELAAERLQRVVAGKARPKGGGAHASGRGAPDARTLRYSPGYCGWNVTGQRALFSTLGPEEVGIRLLPSCLMEPLKSISGVMVTGPVEIHEFENDFPFCSECRTKECRARIQSLRHEAPGIRMPTEGNPNGAA